MPDYNAYTTSKLPLGFSAQSFLSMTKAESHSFPGQKDDCDDPISLLYNYSLPWINYYVRSNSCA